MIGTEIAAKLARMSQADREEAMKLLNVLNKRRAQRKIMTMYPDEGEFRRALYPKHIEFMDSTAHYREVCFMAANRVGKTVAGASMTTYHLTGRYPPWWKGARFSEPVNWWAAGDTAKTTRDIVQHELLGPPGEYGTGMIPGEDIIRTTPKSGVPDAVDMVYVQHRTAKGEKDGISKIGLKSYDQGRLAFQGTAQHGIWLDEECPMDVYLECLIRTMTTKGLIYLTFTPLKGLTDVALMFLPNGTIPSSS